MTSKLDGIADDLAAEFDALAPVVRSLSAAELRTMTPADGWTVVDQLGHLAGFDEAARTALVDPDGFVADLDRRLREGDDPIAGYLDRGRSMEPLAVVSWWATAHDELLASVRQADPARRVPWYGPPMSAMSFVTARLMELWAHGQDIRDALGLAPSVSPRLRHVAHIGVGAMPYSFGVRDLPLPDAPVSVVLAAPDGSDPYQWGPADAADRVTGPALDFCLVVTQRRHLADTALEVTGPVATQWMSIAQAFAGGPGAGRSPLATS